MNRRVVFARIGYMNYYAGSQKGDVRPKHGGSYNLKKIGHEVFNFQTVDGDIYGYFQPYLKRHTKKPVTLNLARIDPIAKNHDKLDNVLVIFISRSDIEGQVIIGWYNKADAFRIYQQPINGMHRGKYKYNLKVKGKNAVLLPDKYRKYSIPKGKGGFGRANVVYTYEHDGLPKDFRTSKYKWIGHAIKYIKSYDGPNLLSDSMRNVEDQISDIVEIQKTEIAGQGYHITPELRKQIEVLAMKTATRYFEVHGYKVKEVGQIKSYDLECFKGKDTLRVEVKGTQTDGSIIILTKNEVSNANGYKTALFVLHSIKCKKKGKSKILPINGKIFVLNPWKLKTHGRLKSLSYMYEIHGKG